MENNLAALIIILDDIIKQFDKNCNRWHAHEVTQSKHVDNDMEHYARLRVFQDDLVKEAERGEQITVGALIDADLDERGNPGR